ncbi:hypothetical protein FRC01_000464 [Tulasnella sp. 417]|nr:hypothetical protein FRC01_000464 [Tulasnella sp. 417]
MVDVRAARSEIAEVSEGVYWAQSGVQELNQHVMTWSDQVSTGLYQMDVGLTGVTHDVRRLEAAVLDQRLLLLPSAKARYDSQSREGAHGCFQGTRKKVLREIYDWVNSKGPESPPILWLCGLAGIGKSTIAHTVAEEIDADGRLGASFFFSRDQADRRNPQLVYPTIASQLASLDLGLKRLIATAVERNHEVGTAVMKKQFEKLISEPLAAWRGTQGTIVIVMDALDECYTESGAEEILIRWAAELPRIPVPLKVLITSRPEFHIRTKFQSLSLRRISRPYILHDIEKSIVKEDIESFLRHRLNQVAEEHAIPTPWPSEGVLRKLVDRAGILFIFAFTVVKFIQRGKKRNPEARLEMLLKEDASSGSSQYRDIDTLYMQVLRYALFSNEEDDDDEDKEKIRKEFSIVLGAVVLLRDPLSSKSLESLLALDDGTTRSALLHLHSVLIVPESLDDEIRLLHPSFHDFLTCPARCPDPHLHADPQRNHTRLAEGCLHILLKELKHDPCGLGNLWLVNAEISDLPERLHKYTPSHLRYACRHFVGHLSEAPPTHERLADLVVLFCNCQLLAWVETLSLLGEVDNCIISLRLLQDWYKNVASPLRETLELLHDANRMVMEFGRGIRRSSGHIYTSVLPFSPPCRLKQQYYRAVRFDYITRGLPTCWNPTYCTMDLPAVVRCITYSSDGNLIAAGTEGDGIHVFNSSTGAEIVTFKESDENINAVTFAPDSGRIASASRNKAIVWDVTTGARLVTLEGHTGEINTVAFASDGIKALTGSWDCTLGVWDSRNGHLISRRSNGCDPYLESSYAVALSPDTETIARCIDDFVEIWDWQSDRPTKKLEASQGGYYDTIHFLPGNVHLMAQLSHGNALDVWDYQMETLLQSISIGGDFAISSFGYQMVRRHSPSGSVTIWDTETWSLVGELIQGNEFLEEDPLKHPPSFAFSPNGRMLAYCPSTTHIGVWEFSKECLGPHGSVDPVDNGVIGLYALAVSADGSHVMFNAHIPLDGERGWYTVLKVWDLVHGGPPKTRICDEPFKSLDCSPDGRLFMSVESPTYEESRKITLWESKTLRQLFTPVDVGDPFRIVRLSARITVETVTADRLAAFGVPDGQPTFLEVRDDTLWEFDGSAERPLCWLPISWRRAYCRGNMIWSGLVLVFGLLGGDIGVLNIDSLRRDCTSTKRARTE